MSRIVERSLLLIKPDGVQRGLVGRILTRVENAGLSPTAITMRRVDAEFAAGHYAATDAQLAQMGAKMHAAFVEAGLDTTDTFGTDDPIELGRLISAWNLDYLTSGPVVAVVIEGPEAVRKLRALCGPTMPTTAPPGTIRGDYATDSPLSAAAGRRAVRNVVHASDNQLDPDEPEREIAHWFAPSGPDITA